MNKKDLFARIKETAINEMPDVRNRIDIKKAIIEEPNETVRAPFNLRRAFSYTFAALFILVSGVLGFNLINQFEDETPLESSTEIVGFQTISAASLLDSFEIIELSNSEEDESILLLANGPTTTETEVVEEDPIVEHLALINRYLNMSETMVANSNEYSYTILISDREDFEYAFKYNGTDLAGNLITYRCYYNIIEEDDAEIEQGIIVHGEKVYRYRSMVVEDGETTVYHYRIRIDDENYIDVNKLTSENGQVFSYKVVEDNEIAHTSRVALKANQNNLKATIQITTNDDQEINLNVSRDNSNKEEQVFNVRYSMMNQGEITEGHFSVTLQFNQNEDAYQYRYVINEEETVVVSRTKKGSQKATEDDFNEEDESTNQYATQAQTTTEHDVPGSTNTNPGNGQGTNNRHDNRKEDGQTNSSISM